MKNFVERFGPWALVTGASAGTGEAFARRLAECGLNLVLVARREDRLKNLAEELQCKHSVKTRVIAVDLSQQDFLPIVEQATANRAASVPAKRLGNPDEFGAACAFLCSSHAGFITGQNLLMDGGIFPGAF